MIKQPSSLQDIIQNRLCSGCGACAAMAPHSIEMRETEDENRRPDIRQNIQKNLERAIINACPGASSSNSDMSSDVSRAWGPVFDVWEGFAADEVIRYQGSSGGAVTALSLFALEALNYSGVLHVKARKDQPTLNEAALSTDRTELLEGSGSRYAPASVCDRLDLISSAADKCVLVGKPCDVAGAAAVAAHDLKVAKNLGLTISIFCAGTPSHEGTKALLTALAPNGKANLAALKYRGNGWPGEMEATWQDEAGSIQVKSTSYADGWGNILQKYRQWRCHTCADHTGETADISVGDPWQTPPDGVAHGKSLIVVRTKRGEEIMRRAIAAGYIVAEPRSPEILFAAQPNLFVTKGAVWARSVVTGLLGRGAPAPRRDSFACWLQLPLKAKAQSFLGTAKRVFTKKLYQRKQINWLEEGKPS